MVRILFVLIALFADGIVQAADPRVSDIENRVSGVQSRVATVENRVSGVQSRLATLEEKVDDSAAALVLILFGAFCALWAQNTGRNSWLWFFLGLFFSVIAVLVVLAKNSGDIDRRRRKGSRRELNLQEFRAQ